MKKSEGITLIALIITIIIMLILAGVTISIAVNGGLFKQAQSAADATKRAAIDEQAKTLQAEYEMWKYTTTGTNTISDFFTYKEGNNEGTWDGTTFTDKNGYTYTIGEDTKGNEIIVGQGGGGTTAGSTNTTPEDTTTNNTPPPAVHEIKQADVTPTGGSISQQSGVIEIAWLDMNNNVIPNPLGPVAKTGMTPVKWNGTTETTTTAADTSWYNYQAQPGATDGHTSNWANVKIDADGSYFVWIPRYAYKIIYFDTVDHANYYRTNGEDAGFDKSWVTGFSTVYGMVDTANKVVSGTTPNIAATDRVQTAGYTDYIPHPAFLGTGYEDLGGGFGTNSKGIAGFWMGKYEASMDNASGVNVNTSSATIGNVAISASAKLVSKPNVISWRNINIANMYNNSKSYNAAYDSHLVKNSEWRSSGIFNT